MATRCKTLGFFFFKNVEVAATFKIKDVWKIKIGDNLCVYVCQYTTYIIIKSSSDQKLHKKNNLIIICKISLIQALYVVIYQITSHVRICTSSTQPTKQYNTNQTNTR